jgi:peptidyl-prolyl cis-trans isomerase SurA
VYGPAAQSSGEQGPTVDRIVAVVDGDPITKRELERYRVTGAPFLSAEVRSDDRALLEALIEQKLLRLEFVKHGISAPDSMVDRYIQNILAETKQTRAQLEADIARAGITWKDYYERMREEVQRIQLVNLLIRARVNVPEEEVRRVWEENPEFLESEKLEVGAIFLPLPDDPAAAEKVRASAATIRGDAVSNFEATASKHSQGPGADEGGRLGQFDRGTMAPHFEKALNGLGEGEVSEPVEASGGIWIVKLIDVKKAGRQEFDDVKEELTEQLYEKRLNERYRKWATEDLRKEHRIEILAAVSGGPARA